MYFAKERRGNAKVIEADSAIPGRYYTCPTCLADVYLRRGRWRVAHFAHRAGTGKPDCENFHPSDGLIYSWPGYGSQGGSHPNYRPSDPLTLSIELQPASMVRGSRFRGWELRLTVPKSEDTHGQITIDCGAGSKRKITLIKLSLGAQTYPVDPNSEDFGAVWVSPEVRSEYRAVVEDRVRGLDRELATLFASTTQRLKPRVERVVWGGSYYLIWHEEFELSQPRTLTIQSLATMGNWRCGLVALPDDEDAEVKAWLEEVTGASVSSLRRAFGLIYPAPVGFDILGRLNLPTADELVVGLRQTEADGSDTVVVHATAGGSSVQVSLEGAGRHLLQITLDASRAHVSLRLNETALPVLLPTSLPGEDILPRVRMVVRDAVTSAKTQQSLSSNTGLALLEVVRSGKAVISELSSPSGVVGQLRWKRESDLNWTKLQIGHESETAIVLANSDELDQLNEVVPNRVFEVELDFGAFGIFKALAQASQRASFAAAIPASLRSRMNWLLTASHVFVDDSGVPVRRLSDEKIISLINKARISPPLAAQRRSIAVDLARACSGGFS